VKERFPTKNNYRFALALLMALLATLTAVSGVSAHNSGHIILPDGQCLNVGSLEEAPVVGDGNPHQLPNGQLDLIPGSGDQYGTRFAAEQGSSAVLPGECP
jgi:hypothetical protein